MSNDEIYFDHAASSPILPEVAEHLHSLYKKRLGNSSSIHHSGVRASLELEKARQVVANILQSEDDEIFFTSGATESNNLILTGIFRLFGETKNEIIVSSIEHSSIKEIANNLKDYGAKVHLVEVDTEGRVQLDSLKSLINDKTLCVSIMHANNEIGTIQDLKTIGSFCGSKGIIFHSDGAQSFCKVPVNVKDMGIDFFTFSSHKIHGPKGAGGVFIRKGLKLHPLFYGGGQESQIRPGTVPVELISSMAFATKLYNDVSIGFLKDLQKYFISQLQMKIPDLKFYGSFEHRLPNLINVGIPGISAKDILAKLDRKGIRASAGSACFSSKKTASHVLKAIGLSDEEAFEALRISWGLDSSRFEIDRFIHELTEIVRT